MKMIPSSVVRARCSRSFFASLVFLTLLASGCTKHSIATMEAVRIETAGHIITAEIEGTPAVETHSDFAVIGSPHGRVVVEHERVRLDDLEWTAVPAGVPVNISLVRNKARITAGNVTIGRTIRD